MTNHIEESEVTRHEVERVITAAKDALTDEMVARLASTAGDAMELMDQANRAGLGKAIPALAQLVSSGDLERIVQLARLYSSAQDALTDEMVGRLTEAVGEGLTLLDQVNRSGLDRAIPALAEFVRSGDLDRLIKLGRLYSSMEDALTEEMIGRIAEMMGNGMTLLDRFSRGGAVHIVDLLEKLQGSGELERIAAVLPQIAARLELVNGLLKCVESATIESEQAPRAPGGLVATWRIMNDPENQETLRFMLNVGKQLRQRGISGK
jgi:uncharacterized protein YjgD (DUF1641 family)